MADPTGLACRTPRQLPRFCCSCQNLAASNGCSAAGLGCGRCALTDVAMPPTMPRVTSAAIMILVMIISPLETDETGLSRLNHDRRRCGPMERNSSVHTFPVDFSFVFFCFGAPTRCGGASWLPLFDSVRALQGTHVANYGRNLRVRNSREHRHVAVVPMMRGHAPAHGAEERAVAVM